MLTGERRFEGYLRQTWNADDLDEAVSGAKGRLTIKIC